MVSGVSRSIADQWPLVVSFAAKSSMRTTPMHVMRASPCRLRPRVSLPVVVTQGWRCSGCRRLAQRIAYLFRLAGETVTDLFISYIRKKNPAR